MSDVGSMSEKAQMIRIGFEDRYERINLQCKFDLAILFFALSH